MSIGAKRTHEELTPDEVEQLRRARTRLLEAAREADEFRGKELQPGKDPEPKNLDEMARAYAAVDNAERDVWELRERLMGWSRPASSISARESIDWLLEDLEGERES